jgi:hypothetical protein
MFSINHSNPNRMLRLGLVISFALGAAQATGCSDTTATRTPSSISAVSGGDQTFVAGGAATATFVVSVLDQNGAALEGVSVTWALSSGEGSLASTLTTTDANGQASVTFSPGADAGTSLVTAAVGELSPVQFTVTTVADSTSGQ